jgi:hypothetical protein
VLDFVGESVALASVAVVVASGSVVEGSVVLGRGSKENVWLVCDAERVVVFCIWLVVGSCAEDDSTTCGGTDTVMYVVDVLVTVPMC